MRCQKASSYRGHCADYIPIYLTSDGACGQEAISCLLHLWGRGIKTVLTRSLEDIMNLERVLLHMKTMLYNTVSIVALVYVLTYQVHAVRLACT